MDKIVIEGGSSLRGKVLISGAKNAALPLICATILAPGKNILTNVPRLGDVRTVLKLLAIIGAEVDLEWPRVVVDTSELDNPVAPYELVKTMRAAILVLGPLVARYGHAKVSLPGGCAIGARPINLHLKALEAMGATIEIKRGYVEVTCDRLRGARIDFPVATVGGTENVMMAASLALGVTHIHNAAREPEIEDLANMLNAMGAKVEGAGTSTIVITGVDSLHAVEHRVIPDRIEAGTFMIGAALNQGEVELQGVNPSHLTSVIDHLRRAGVTIETRTDSILVRGPSKITPFEIVTEPHPGFPTDMQAQFMVLALAAHGKSIITESIFENRFMHVPELVRMGAQIDVQSRAAHLLGPAFLEGTTVMATDLRASASLILAGLIAEGTTQVLRVYHLDRGYENIVDKLQGLGARISRVPSELF
ncbi:UDP-N-acetylglucosamine 1-carboxyvinyltransferase [Myxococcota bacterium]|nr:UDP-N-acetylglucosamine 1-carboxyvinyltransferase [Myxococcota bacterium]